MTIFSIENDIEVISADGFWCEGCVTGKPLDDVSPDPRYCIGCYGVLGREVELLIISGATRKPKWCPKGDAKIDALKEEIVPHDVSLIMHTVEGEKTKVGIIPPVTPKVTCGKRGPKFRALPVALIKKLAGEGLGSKAIVSRLKAEGIKVHYSTIQRIQSGQRQLALPIEGK